MDEKPFPIVDLQLLEALREHYPDRSPNRSDSDRDIWIKVGQVEVVRFLSRMFQEQNENILDRKVT